MPSCDWPTVCLQIFVGRFYWQTKLANFIVRLTPGLRERSVRYHAEEADALKTRAAAAEEAENGDAAPDGDDGDRKLIDGQYRTGGNAA